MNFSGYPLDLPTQFTEFRPHQEEAIAAVLQHFQYRPFVFLDAPTGAGKTLIGETVGQVLRAEGKAAKRMYLCTTKTLQAQFLHDFSYAKLIKGRSNYETLDQPDRFLLKGPRHLNGGHCTKTNLGDDDFPVCDQCSLELPDTHYTPGDPQTPRFLHCHHCHPWQSCPYEVAKNDALYAELAVANTSYFMTEANGPGRFGQTRSGTTPFDFVIVDEADTLESVIMSHIELRVPRGLLRDLDVEQPHHVTKPEDWLVWTVDLIDQLTKRVVELGRKVATYQANPPPTQLQKEYDSMSRYLLKVTQVSTALKVEPDNWVFDGYQSGQTLTLRPVVINARVRDLLWRHSQRFLLMSATLISPHQMANDLGLDTSEWEAVEVNSSFPKERRPIHINPAVSMTHKSADTDLPIMAKAVVEILDQFPGERVLVHTVSYPRAQYLFDAIIKTPHGDRALMYHTADEREHVLDQFRRSMGAVLLAPSMDRGVDLPYDSCRVIVVTKIPFPNMGDKQVSKRMYTPGGKSWYSVQTIRSLVQMTGRGMRFEDDQCTTFILDGQFGSNLWPSSYRVIPRWWKEAVIWQAPV